MDITQYYIPSPDELLHCLYLEVNCRFVYKPSFGLYLLYPQDELSIATIELVCSVRISGKNNNVNAIAQVANEWLGIDVITYNYQLEKYNCTAEQMDLPKIPLIARN